MLPDASLRAAMLWAATTVGLAFSWQHAADDGEPLRVC
jgi:hypothetical protein